MYIVTSTSKTFQQYRGHTYYSILGVNQFGERMRYAHFTALNGYNVTLQATDDTWEIDIFCLATQELAAHIRSYRTGARAGLKLIDSIIDHGKSGGTLQTLVSLADLVMQYDHTREDMIYALVHA